MEYLSLEHAISAICSSSKYHICIHDVSGILKTSGMSVSYLNATHSTEFCNLAKSTEKGFELCMKCKNCANRIAIQNKSYFCGLCAYGLFEAVKPVVIDGKTVCIIYIGNICVNYDESLIKLSAASQKTGVPYDAMKEYLKENTAGTDKQTAYTTAMLLDSYIRLIYDKNKSVETDSPYHWAVYNIKKYADENYSRTFTLQEICQLYFVNEKYAGRLFAAQIGMSFHEYLNNVRLERAAKKLVAESGSITDIAMSCGFNNVTYFNKKFRGKYGVSPGKYRKLK